jgi:copper/silver efflux system protein
MVGGLVTSFLLELTVYPAIFAIWKGRGSSRSQTENGAAFDGEPGPISP